MARFQGLTREARKAQTREAILEASTRLFVHQGISATSFDQIAQAIGLTRGAVYAHFKSKRALVDAVAERAEVPLSYDVLYQVDLPLDERLRRLIRELMEIRRKVPKRTLILDAEYFAESLRSPGTGRYSKSRYLAKVKEIAQRLRQANEARGERPPVDEEDFVVLVIAFARAIIHQVALQSPDTDDRSVETLFGLLGGQHR
jgi:AcrR family transcriptional regulator